MDRKYGLTAKGKPRLRRPKRSAKDIGDPQSEENRYTVKLNGRVPRELAERFSACVKDMDGVTQSSVLTEFMEDFLSKNEAGPD